MCSAGRGFRLHHFARSPRFRNTIGGRSTFPLVATTRDGGGSFLSPLPPRVCETVHDPGETGGASVDKSPPDL